MRIESTKDLDRAKAQRPRKLELADAAVLNADEAEGDGLKNPENPTDLDLFAGRVKTIPKSPFVVAGGAGVAATGAFSHMSQDQILGIVTTTGPKIGLTKDRFQPVANSLYEVSRNPVFKTVVVSASAGVISAGAIDRAFPRLGTGWKIAFGLAVTLVSAYLLWWVFTGEWLF